RDDLDPSDLADALRDQMQPAFGGREVQHHGGRQQDEHDGQGREHAEGDPPLAHSFGEMLRCRRGLLLVESGLATSIPRVTTGRRYLRPTPAEYAIGSPKRLNA